MKHRNNNQLSLARQGKFPARFRALKRTAKFRMSLTRLFFVFVSIRTIQIFFLKSENKNSDVTIAIIDFTIATVDFTVAIVGFTPVIVESIVAIVGFKVAIIKPTIAILVSIVAIVDSTIAIVESKICYLRVLNLCIY